MPEDAERLDYLRRLDEREDVDVSPWEADFLDSILKRGTTHFTDKQRAVIDRMRERYG